MKPTTILSAGLPLREAVDDTHAPYDLKMPRTDYRFGIKLLCPVCGSERTFIDADADPQLVGNDVIVNRPGFVDYIPMDGAPVRREEARNHNYYKVAIPFVCENGHDWQIFIGSGRATTNETHTAALEVALSDECYQALYPEYAALMAEERDAEKAAGLTTQKAEVQL